jgi:hypothetical protein
MSRSGCGFANFALTPESERYWPPAPGPYSPYDAVNPAVEMERLAKLKAWTG